jgi:lysyl-tRNA synthetase class 1
VAKNFSAKQKAALGVLLAYVKAEEKLDGQGLHTKLHDIKKESSIEPKELFSAIYLAFLGKESGPKAGWFLSVLDKKFLEKRLEEVINYR